MAAKLCGSPLAIYFFIFFSHLVRTDEVQSSDESVSEGKYLPFYFYEGGGGCSCSVMILS